MTEPSVLIPVAPGTNRDGELAEAFRAAGARTAQVPLEELRRGTVKIVDHQLLALPGGFSYGDALGAGQLLGLDLAGWFADELTEARHRGMPIIGICNGFQALVRAGLLPGPVGDADRSSAQPPVRATLAANQCGHFECRWVDLRVEPARTPWLAAVDGPLRCPVAHGEGRFVASDLDRLEEAGMVALRYANAEGHPAREAYPANPNGSAGDVAGVVDASGLVLGLMPHPEDHVLARQDPARRRQPGGSCLGLFRAGVRMAAGG